MQLLAKVLAVLGVLAVSALVSARFSQDGAMVPPDRGASLFRLHCASCHGPDGHGDGPLAEYLRVPPSDLSRLGSRPQEVDRAWLATVIDGRQRIRGHGSTRMPVWGMSFSADLSGREDLVRQLIEDLADHVFELQDEKQP